MNIEVVFRHEDLPPALREYAATQMTGIERYGEEFEGGEVVLDKVHATFECEAILRRHRGEPIVAKESATDARAALDGAVAKLQKQFLKFKDKHSAKARRHQANEDK